MTSCNRAVQQGQTAMTWVHNTSEHSGACCSQIMTPLGFHAYYVALRLAFLNCAELQVCAE